MSDLTSTPLGPIIAKSRLRLYPKNQIVLYQGDMPMQAYIIKSGALKIYELDDDNEKILHIIGPGAIFPAVQLFSYAKSNTTFYATLSDCEFYMITTEEFNKTLERDNTFALFCLHWFAGEVKEIMNRMGSLEKTDTKRKLLTALDFLSRQHSTEMQNKTWVRVNFPVSHQLLADMIGVTRESTTLVMGELQQAGLVASPRQTTLEINIQSLHELV